MAFNKSYVEIQCDPVAYRRSFREIQQERHRRKIEERRKQQHEILRRKEREQKQAEKREARKRSEQPHDENYKWWLWGWGGTEKQLLQPGDANEPPKWVQRKVERRIAQVRKEKQRRGQQPMPEDAVQKFGRAAYTPVVVSHYRKHLLDDEYHGSLPDRLNQHIVLRSYKQYLVLKDLGF